MTFEDFFIDSSDFNFYLSLPDNERLLFLYDLICTDYYTDNEKDITPDHFDGVDFSTNINSTSYRDIISSVLDKAIDLRSNVNVIFINGLVIFNSESKKNLSYAILDMVFDGVLLDQINMPENLMDIFKRQTYCEIYSILEITDPLIS